MSAERAQCLVDERFVVGRLYSMHGVRHRTHGGIAHNYTTQRTHQRCQFVRLIQHSKLLHSFIEQSYIHSTTEHHFWLAHIHTRVAMLYCTYQPIARMAQYIGWY